MKKLRDIKEQLSKLSREAKEAATDVKSSVEKGVKTSKDVVDKTRDFWGKFLNKENLKSGLEVTSKGANIVAKGARLASKGADSIATGVERASKEIQKMGEKIKD